MNCYKYFLDKFFIIREFILSIPGGSLCFHLIIIFLSSLGQISLQLVCLLMGMKYLLVAVITLQVKEVVPRAEFVRQTVEKKSARVLNFRNPLIRYFFCFSCKSGRP